MENESERGAWFVYIVECKDRSFYTGISQNVEERVKAHNSSKGSLHTRALAPVRLVWWESHQNLELARRKEMQIKGWTRIKKLALISGDMASLRNL